MEYSRIKVALCCGLDPLSGAQQKKRYYTCHNQLNSLDFGDFSHGDRIYHDRQIHRGPIRLVIGEGVSLDP